DARDQRAGAYSLGMKRKLSLVEALVHRPEILLLDEPTLALDYRAELDLIERIQLVSLTGAAVILATNDVHLAERICDRVLFLHQGRIIREGHVPTLLSELAGSKEVELQMHSPVPLENLRALPSVEAGSGHQAELSSPDRDAAHPRWRTPLFRRDRSHHAGRGHRSGRLGSRAQPRAFDRPGPAISNAAGPAGTPVVRAPGHQCGNRLHADCSSPDPGQDPVTRSLCLVACSDPHH